MGLFEVTFILTAVMVSGRISVKSRSQLKKQKWILSTLQLIAVL